MRASMAIAAIIRGSSERRCAVARATSWGAPRWPRPTAAIARVAAALAARIDGSVLDYCVFGHCSAEHAHRALLAHLNVQPLLDVGMRLGEGTGAAVALSTVRAALALFTDMATFDSAGVSGKDS